MGDARLPTVQEEERQKSLDPQRFAYISDDTYTTAEVEAYTQASPRAAPRAGLRRWPAPPPPPA